jgi:HD-GYP domain-containing protein (c-di-GMP phosphodiesterase class II)
LELLRLSSLKPGVRLDRPVFHAGGEMLLEIGSTLSAEAIRLLGEAGIEELFRPEPGEDPGEFILAARNEVIPVDALKVGQRTTRPIFDRGGALLAEAGAVITERLAAGLRRRGVERIYVRRNTAELRVEQVRAFQRARRRDHGRRPAPFREQLDAARVLAPEDCTARRLDELLDAGGEVVLPRDGEPLAEKLKAHDPLSPRPARAKDGYLVMYEEAVAQTAAIFHSFETNRDVDREKVGDLSRGVLGGLVEDRDLLLNLNNLRTEYNYLVGHTLGVTVLAIAVAAARGYGPRLVLEMGYAAFLHDIGMLRVPAEIVSRPGRLPPAEVMQVRRHPVYGLDMLQKLVGRRSGIPRSIPIVAYQSHERENGSGYPKGRSGRVIHDFAKILAICDVYNALTARRPWREGLLPYLAMEQIVLMGARREFDPEVIRALLRYVSLFPIGSWVELSDGSRARVVAGNESNFARPAVSVVWRGAQRLEPPERVDLAAQQDLEIIRPAPEPEESPEPMEGF